MEAGRRRPPNPARGEEEGPEPGQRSGNGGGFALQVESQALVTDGTLEVGDREKGLDDARGSDWVVTACDCLGAICPKGSLRDSPASLHRRRRHLLWVCQPAVCVLPLCPHPQPRRAGVTRAGPHAGSV